MGLFNRKKAEEKIDEFAAKAEEKAAEIKQEAEAAAEKLAAAAKEKAAEVEEAVSAAVSETAEKIEEAVNGEEAPAAEAPAAEEEAPAEEGAPSCGEPEGAPEITPKEVGTVYATHMNYHAGYNVYKPWDNGGMTIHSGIGWFHPFGPSEYYGMANIPGNWCEEAKAFPLETFFTEDWMKNFETDLFCIYRMADGDIYAWDGIFAVRGVDAHKCIGFNSELQRQDVLINVIVGGTGRYEGARGLMIGTAEGAGTGKVCGKWPDGKDLELPETIMKDLQGYIRFPEKD